MWESFERRLEAEHYLGPTVRAQELIKQIIDMSVETSEEAFRSKLDPLTYDDLRAFYSRMVELTSGPAGQAEGNAGTERRESHRERLLALRAVSGTVLGEAAKARTTHLDAQDVEFVVACAPIDERVANTVRGLYVGQATDDDVVALAAQPVTTKSSAPALRSRRPAAGCSG